MEAFALACTYEARVEEAKQGHHFLPKWNNTSLTPHTNSSSPKFPPNPYQLTSTQLVHSTSVAHTHTLHKLILPSLNQTRYHQFYPPQIYQSAVLIQPNFVTNVKRDCVITAIKNTALTIAVTVSFCFLWVQMMSNLIFVKNCCHQILSKRS